MTDKMPPESTPLDEVRRYYTQKVRQHGPTAQGVDWRDEGSQEIRFQELAEIIGDDSTASIADIGCGYGALVPFLRARGWQGHYEGVDVSEEMIEAAQRYLCKDRDVQLTVGQSASQPADFTVASGIFNVRGATSSAVWKEYVFRTIDQMVKSSRRGVAFNCLSSWSDAPLMRDDLYYADPEQIFAYCASHHSRWIEISQDYELFEFTVRLRLDSRFPALRALR